MFVIQHLDGTKNGTVRTYLIFYIWRNSSIGRAIHREVILIDLLLELIDKVNTRMV